MTWRQGTRVPIHLYDQLGPEPDTRPWPDGDRPVATFHDLRDAARAVEMEAVLRELVAGADDYRCWWIPDEIHARVRAVAYPEET